MTGLKAIDVAAELRDLRREVANLSAGLVQIVAAQEMQTELLRSLLVAATEGDGVDGGLTAALREIARALSAQGATLSAIRTDLAARPPGGER